MNAVLKAYAWRLRAMRYADLKPIMAIERRAYPFPWTPAIMRDCIRVGYRCRILEEHGRIEAYGVMSMGANEAHVLNLCVRPESQRRGIARYMLEHLLDLARVSATRTVFLEARPSNPRALRLYRAAGFCELGVRQGYYPDGGKPEDAVVMAKEL